MSVHSLTTAGRIAVVTGAASGIGFEVARQILQSGQRVALLDIAPQDPEKLAVALDAGVSDILSLECDVTNANQVRLAMDRVLATWGSIDILVNSAGWSVNKPFAELTDAEWHKTIDVNFVSILQMCRVCLPTMTSRQWGRIVNISSDAARVGTPRESVYSGAKAAVIGFTKSLAAEVASNGITANVVCPGSTDTPLFRSTLTPAQIERRVKANPSGRIGTSADVAGAVMYFCSDDAGYVNGQVLSVSGGITRVG